MKVYIVFSKLTREYRLVYSYERFLTRVSELSLFIAVNIRITIELYHCITEPHKCSVSHTHRILNYKFSHKATATC